MPAAIDDQKQCCRCREIKYISEFSKRSRNKDGLDYRCKSCIKQEADTKREHLREIDHKSYYKNQKKRIAKSFKYSYISKGKELPEKWQQYLFDKKEPISHEESYNRTLARLKKYKQENKEKMKESWKNYYYSDLEQNRKTSRLKTLKYRTLKASLPNDLTEKDILYLLNIQEEKCGCCGSFFDESFRYEIDHVIPVSKGGGLTLDNVQLLCRSCNASKNNNIIWYRNRPEIYLELT